MKPVVYYDCGVHGKLTVGDIAYRANIHRTTAAARLKRGYRDERLFLPSWGSHRRQVPCADAGLALRFRFALHYAGRVPSIADIRRDFPELGRSCLYRWHKALHAAHLAKGAEAESRDRRASGQLID